MSLDQELHKTTNCKTPRFTYVCPDPNGTAVNGCDSFKTLSDECDRGDAMSEASSTSSFALSPDKEVDVEGVFQNIVAMYQQQLRNIDDLDWDENRKLQEKVKVLEDFIDHLLEQNEALVSTAAELERETKKRVHQMESRLKKSARSTKEVVLCLHDYEQHIQDLFRVKAQIVAELEDIRRQNSTVKVENGFLRDQNANLRHDLHALLHIIQQARSTGNWEMDWVTFCELSPEQVFGPIGTFSRVHSGESLAQTASVHSPDELVYRGYCYSDRGSGGASHYGSFTNLHELDQSLAKKYDPDCMNRLQVENRHLQKLREQLQMELLEKDKIIANLESQITCLNQEITLGRLESDRQFLICRAQSLEEAARPGSSLNPINHGHSLPYLCRHDSCGNCGTPLLPQERDTVSQQAHCQPAAVSNSLQSLTSHSRKDSGDPTPVDSLHDYFSRKDQHISGLFESTYVQTEAAAVASICIQTERKNSSILVQTEEPKKTVDDLMQNVSDETHRKNMESMKALLRRAEDKASSKEMLILQLQTHLQTSVREVELKDTALENAENKLDSSRKECAALKEKILDLENEILGQKEDLQHQSNLQKNLQENVEARDEKLKETKVLEQTLQDQKRRLLTQVDEQGEEILRYETELQSVEAQLKAAKAEAELQKLTIQNLQEAVIASKNVHDSRRETYNPQNANAQYNLARRAMSQNSVLDI